MSVSYTHLDVYKRQEYIAGEITDKDLDPNDPLINYSTSCNYKRAKIRGILKMCLKRHPRAKLLKGKTEITCGPSQITKNRCPERKSCLLYTSTIYTVCTVYMCYF